MLPSHASCVRSRGIESRVARQSAGIKATPLSPPDAANAADAGLVPAVNVTPSCGTVGKIFLQTFVSSWIAAKTDRAQRVRIIKTIMEQVQAEEQVNASGWSPAYVETKLKKLAAATRAPQ